MSDSIPELVGVAGTSFECSNCGEAIERGYVPADSDDGATYEVRADAAVCDACGWAEVGFAGCAPTLSDLLDSDDAVLARLEPGDDGLAVASITDRTE